MSLIDPQDVLAISAVLVSLTWLGFAVDASKLGKAIPGVVIILACGSILSNLKITPFSSTASDFVGQYIVATAIPLLMIKADLKTIFVESGRVMVGFTAAPQRLPLSTAYRGLLLLRYLSLEIPSQSFTDSGDAGFYRPTVVPR